MYYTHKCTYILQWIQDTILIHYDVFNSTPIRKWVSDRKYSPNRKRKLTNRRDGIVIYLGVLYTDT